MRPEAPFDEALAGRLPLPLAQLYRRAHDAGSAVERHLAAFYLWEAGLKLLGCVAVVEYAARGDHDPAIDERLQNLARPALGHWREFVRLLVPRLAEAGDRPFARLRDLLGESRDDLPVAAGLDALLRQQPGGAPVARSTVCLGELLDRLVSYRNREIGHGAAGMGGATDYDRMAGALRGAAAEVFGKLDTLAGRRLVYVSEVKQVAGMWRVQLVELLGERGKPLPAVELARDATDRVPDGERVYLEGDGGTQPLHPLLLYDGEAREALFLNARRGQRRAEYLCYTNNRTDDRQDLGGEQCRLLAQVLGLQAVEAGQAAAWAARAQADEPPPETTTERPRLGEFELLSELGRGGHGAVYRAWQPSLRRQVAVKELLRFGDSREWARQQARFRREIRALGRVKHRHLVGVFTEGKEGERWFYVMDLIEGATLWKVGERLRGGASGPETITLQSWQHAVSTTWEHARREEKPLGEAAPEAPAVPMEAPGVAELPAGGRGYVYRVAELGRQVAEAAHALHEAGIVHRDIKPGNVQVRTGGAEAVLMDLGVAQWSEGADEKLTTGRDIPGTLRYASPEQVLARGLVDRRSDVYSLGATLWEMLALRPLYEAADKAADSHGKSEAELIRSIQFDEPGSVRAYNPAVPADLDAVIGKCLEKDARKRYATARELAEDLGRFLAGDPVQARPVGRVGRGLRWLSRRPAVAGLLGVMLVAVLALVAGAVSLYYSGQLQALLADAEQQRDIAQQEREEAQQQRGIADMEKHRAEEARAEADRQRALVRRLLYFSRINMADRAWHDNEMARMELLLEELRPGPGDAEDLRGFEWHYLWRLRHSSLLALKGHAREVTSVAYRPDGKRLASASFDWTVKVWDAVTGQEARSFKGHTGAVTSVAYNPDGKRLASASWDGVKVWDAVTGQEALSLKGHTGGVLSLAYSPDGKRLAGASDDGTVKVWDLATGREALSLKGHSGSVYSVAYSPDGKRLASAGGEPFYIKGSEVKVWDACTGHLDLSLKGHTDRVASVAFSPDGKRLASASWDGTVKVWNTATGQLTLTIKSHAAQVYSVAYSPDGKRLASAVGEYDKPGEVKAWDAVTGQEAFSLKGHTGRVTSVAYSPDGKRLASASEDATMKVWDAATGQDALSLEGHTSEVRSVAYNPDGKRLASASCLEVKVWDAVTGQEALSFEGHIGWLTSVAYSPDGKRLASASEDGTVKVWDAATGQQARSFEGHAGRVASVAFSPDGKRLASASWDGTVKVWNTATEQLTLTIKSHAGSVNSVAYSPDGKRLASASGMEVKVWDAATGQPVLSLKGDTGPVYSVAYSPDGKRLAAASGDRTVRVWDAVTGQEALSLKGHTGSVYSVAYSPDGKRLASASDDKTVRVWDAVTGQEALSLKGHTGSVESVAYSPDGKCLGGASNQGAVMVWQATAPPERAEAGH
jgi:WD40 repeat protein/serine/threonine protein kinase